MVGVASCLKYIWKADLVVGNMLNSNRTRTSQLKHDRKVSELALNLLGKGYQVWAEVPEFPNPPTVLGYTPDIKARKLSQEIIIEVETLDSLDTARAQKQHDAFISATREKQNLQYRREIIN